MTKTSKNIENFVKNSEGKSQDHYNHVSKNIENFVSNSEGKSQDHYNHVSAK